METTYPMFLYGDISEVHEHVVQVLPRSVVANCAEPTKAELVQVRFQGPV